MQPARFRQADISLVKIDNGKSMSPAVSSGRSAGSFPEQRLVIEPKMAPSKLKVLAKFGLCSNCSQKLDERSLGRAREIFALLYK